MKRNQGCINKATHVLLCTQNQETKLSISCNIQADVCFSFQALASVELAIDGVINAIDGCKKENRLIPPSTLTVKFLPWKLLCSPGGPPQTVIICDVYHMKIRHASCTQVDRLAYNLPMDVQGSLLNRLKFEPSMAGFRSALLFFTITCSGFPPCWEICLTSRSFSFLHRNSKTTQRYTY